MTHFHYESDWKTTLAVAFLFPCLILLGFWQLDRAEEKRALLESFENGRRQSPVNLLQFVDQPQAYWSYKQVQAAGRFDNERHIFLDNRIFQGQFGYEIITPFRLQGSEQLILANRGWVAGSLDRTLLPQIEVLVGDTTILGEVYVPISKPFTIGTAVANDSWPKVVQSLDIESLENQLGEAVFPYQIRLKPDSRGAFQVDWPVVNVQPQKHRAYAVQWFLMALVLVILHLSMSSNGWALLQKYFNKG